jgi:hypothetical protein
MGNMRNGYRAPRSRASDLDELRAIIGNHQQSS